MGVHDLQCPHITHTAWLLLLSASAGIAICPCGCAGAQTPQASQPYCWNRAVQPGLNHPLRSKPGAALRAFAECRWLAQAHAQARAFSMQLYSSCWTPYVMVHAHAAPVLLSS
jgi:hypothetical protein